MRDAAGAVLVERRPRLGARVLFLFCAAWTLMGTIWGVWYGTREHGILPWVGAAILFGLSSACVYAAWARRDPLALLFCEHGIIVVAGPNDERFWPWSSVRTVQWVGDSEAGHWEVG